MSRLDYVFGHGGDLLEIPADVALGWKKLKNGYGFDERTSGPFRGDSRMQIAAYVERSQHLKGVVEFPKELEGSMRTEYLQCSLSGGELIAKVRLRGNPSWRRTEAGNAILVCEAWPVASEGRASCGVNLKIFFFAPPDARPGDIREWDTQFFPGGQVESSRRRH
jgi:hypothetical protein